MSRNVIRISETQRIPVKEQQLQVAAYCRVSTKHEEQQQSLDAQIDYYTNYIQSHPNWVLVAVYSDTASGTRTNQRPGYQQLIRNCTRKKVDLIAHFESGSRKTQIFPLQGAQLSDADTGIE